MTSYLRGLFGWFDLFGPSETGREINLGLFTLSVIKWLGHWVIKSLSKKTQG